MRNLFFCLFIPVILFSCSNIFDGLSFVSHESEYIVFTSEGSSFSPVIIVEGDPLIEWIWDDGTSSQESSPTKDYGSEGQRKNKLRVDPWSSLVRVNIGYDGGDGGSSLIEHVNDQNVSSVENLNLAAPYLRQWCSSYNKLSELDFRDFINIDTIECFKSATLEQVVLDNTPKLQRACFEDCDLISLDLSDCVELRDLRGAMNSYQTINFGSIGADIWHICIRENRQIEENLFSDMTNFPNIRELFIWHDNQSGDLVIPSTGTSGGVNIQAYGNSYEKVDLRGALRDNTWNARINLSENNISEIYLEGCQQITYLDLSDNNLDMTQVDSVLAMIDNFGLSNGYLDLRGNFSPSENSSSIISSLESRFWTVYVD